MDERQIKDLKGWCERMAAASIQFDKTAGECGEMIHFKENKLFFTAEFFPVLVEAYKPQAILYEPDKDHKGEDLESGYEYFYTELCGEKFKIFAIYDNEEERYK